MTVHTRAVIFANGDLQDRTAARAALRPGDRLIAADGGLQHLQALGLTPDVVVGDLDSISPAQAQALDRDGLRVVRYPVRKDETDLELALRLALAEGAGEVLILGGLGGRWDQTLANLLLVAHPDFRGVNVRLLDGRQQLVLIQGRTQIEGQPGDLVSLIPLGGDATGVTTHGLEYPLENGTLRFGSTLGISNVLLDRQAEVEVRSGWVMCIIIAAGDPSAPAAPSPETGDQ